ncbi:MAG TPA: hypothetical protein VIX73_21615 [Kofleriaceae bacterium]|jgi:hypothetical protein
MKPWIVIVALAVTSVEIHLLAGLRGRISPAGRRSAMAEGNNVGTALPTEDVRPDSVHTAAASTFDGDETHDRLAITFRADHAVAGSHELAEALARGARAVLPAGSTLRHVECRSAVCRIETAHANLDEFVDFVDHAFLGHGPPVTARPVYAAVLGDPRPGEPVSAVAYVVLDSSEAARTASLGSRD